jgi:hypothetical protein
MNCALPTLTKAFALAGVALLLAVPLHAQNAASTGSGTAINPWLEVDWLQSSEEKQRQAATGESFQAVTTPAVTDPAAVISSGMLWQDTTGAIYTRQLAAPLTLSCQTTEVEQDEEQISRGQKVALTFKPSDGLTFTGDLHGATTDALLPSDATTTSGGSFTAEGKLPANSTLTFGLRTDRTEPAAPTGLMSQTNAYDAQFKQPIGQLPLSAFVKGHYEGTSEGHAPATTLPSLEQSLEWKPLANTTVQAGLRQQQYQEFPGVDHQLNEALFADWSQKIVDNVSWHSYAEMLNSKGLTGQAPASPVASGANGTPQATTPGSSASPTSSLPVSMDDQTLTLSTGPSVKVQKDISASIEYSNRWDKTPAAGTVGDEQRVSVSVKGSF